MTINTAGQWWIGNDPNDICEFLKSYASDGYEVNEFRLAKCECGSLEFRLESDDNEGVARRTCVTCLRSHFICNSAEYWSDAEPTSWECIECHSHKANVGVGFSLYSDDSTSVKWLYVGERCAECGVLGCVAGWKVAISDTLHLLDEV